MSCTDQPTREHANVTDDTCGSTATRSCPYTRISVPPTPCNSGSPLATTWTSPSTPSRSARSAGSIGDGHGRLTAETVSSSRSSWRCDPKIVGGSAQFVPRRRGEPCHPVGADSDDDDHLVPLLVAHALIGASCATPTAAAAASRRRHGRSIHGIHTVRRPRASARAVAAATCGGVLDMRRGFHPSVIRPITNPGRTSSSRTPEPCSASARPLQNPSSPALAEP